MVNWPLSPNVGDTVTGPNGQVWKWDGVKWVSAAGGSATNTSVTISSTPPANPQEGDMWWDAEGGALYVRFQGQWVAASVEPTFSAPVINQLPWVNSYLAAAVVLAGASTWYNGPTINCGNDGVWFVSGAAVIYPSLATHVGCRIWDGVTTVASTWGYQSAANWGMTYHMSGILSNPAGWITLQARSSAAGTSSMQISNSYGSANGRDTYINAIRIG